MGEGPLLEGGGLIYYIYIPLEFYHTIIMLIFCDICHIKIWIYAIRVAPEQPVYPVDTFGTEYMPLVWQITTLGGRFKNVLISEEGEFEVVKKTQESEGTIIVNDIYADTNIGRQIYKSDKPFAVFCGPRKMEKDSTRQNFFNQILPTGSWGTFYVVPAFSTTLH